MKIVFMGTPDFAAASLEALIHSEHEILYVVTKVDKPVGRKGELTPSAVKVLALEHGLTVHQPVKVREESFVEKLRADKPDVIVVVAYGQIIPKSILEIPKYGCINIHGSLLPKYRGAAPIQWAVLDGEKETGITSMFMDEGLDTGDMLLKKTLILEERETSGTLFDKMKVLGAETLIETLDKLEKGELTPEKQPAESPTAYSKMLTKEMGLIDFNQSAKALDSFIRGMSPWPSAFTHLNGKVLKIWEAFSEEGSCEKEAGEVVEITKDAFFVCCKEGILRVTEVQIEGKKRMSVSDFLRGTSLELGTKFGD